MAFYFYGEILDVGACSFFDARFSRHERSGASHKNVQCQFGAILQGNVQVRRLLINRCNLRMAFAMRSPHCNEALYEAIQTPELYKSAVYITAAGSFAQP